MKKQLLNLSLLIASCNTGASQHAKPKFYDSARYCAGLGAAAVMAVTQCRVLYKPVEARTLAIGVKQAAAAANAQPAQETRYEFDYDYFVRHRVWGIPVAKKGRDYQCK